ncbi:MAG: chemotaxis response regulator protein-glutamate methylesterase [Alphaproteobacteria bacterium]|nr:chemotaxis response regulator protein-glutamate methylesterase [Rhodospirillales bacterium]MCW9045047.1 chemotaxis response regulator protein-glutamate methylesterase [Alphaproteobacteria bacterium]
MVGSAPRKNSDPYRVMIVDDSAVVRGLIARMVEAEVDLDVIASVANGQAAINGLDRYDVEVIILDIEMPVMDGLSALPKLLEKDSTLKIIMASTLTLRNAEISMKALEAGAADYVPKPTSSRELSSGADFKRELITKVKALGAEARRSKTSGSHRPTGFGRPLRATPAPAKRPDVSNRRESIKRPEPVQIRPGPVKIRPPGKTKPQILAIGSSTGGPQALFTFLKGIKGKIDLPIVITQHMPATFTTILAEHITRMTGWPAAEGKNGDVLKSGQVYIAPGDYHMEIVSEGTTKKIKLNQGPQENFCRPAVDPMYRSIVKAYSGNVFGVILTGMGQDGLKGSEALVAAGGTLIAQDEASSVVWGMPGAVATAGLCSAVLPVAELPNFVTRFVAKGGR